MSCQTPGNPDLYGLGVRTAFYTQWTSTLLTTLYIPEEEALYRAVNILMQLAVLICLFFMSAWRTISGPEVMVGFWLLAGALSSLTGDGLSASGTVAGEARLGVYAALSGYGCWFWFGGVDGLPVVSGSCAGERKAVGFLGGTPLMGGWLRVVGKVFSVGGVVTCLGLMFKSVVAWRRRGGARGEEDDG